MLNKRAVRVEIREIKSRMESIDEEMQRTEEPGRWSDLYDELEDRRRRLNTLRDLLWENR